MPRILKSRRRHARYDIVNSCGEPVKASICTGDTQPGIEATLVNLSQTGARLKTAEALPPGTDRSLKLEFGDRQLLSISATILWTEPKNNGEWLNGCKFGSLIKMNVIEELATAGALERRFADRLSTAIECQARRELEGQQPITVQILNHSDGGICLYSPQRLVPAEKLLFEFSGMADQAPILAEVRWCRTADDVHLAGCALLSHGPVPVNAQPREEPIVEPTAAAPESRTAIWTGLALVYGWCALYLAGYWPVLLGR